MFAIRDLIIVTPDGGEELQAGDSYDITWKSKDDIDEVYLYFSTDSSNWTAITPDSVENDAGLNSYLWQVPPVSSTQCLIKVQDDPLSPTTSDTSDSAFTITLPGDLNQDSRVDIDDFVSMAESWLKGWGQYPFPYK